MNCRSFTVGLALLLCSVSAAALAPEEESEHLVQPGETLNGIANRARVPRDRIVEANGLEPPYVIRVGQKLTIPRSDGDSGDEPSKAARSALLADADSHVVQPGETLSGIARDAGIPRVLIAEANGLAPPYDLLAGQTLVLPRTRRHTVKPGETGFGIAYDYAVPWDKIAIANGLDQSAPLHAGRVLLIPSVVDPPEREPVTVIPPAPPAKADESGPVRFSWPISGNIRRAYQPRSALNFHDGIDIVAPRDTAVRAAAAGTVIYAAKEEKQFGNLVVIDHGRDWYSAYGSLGRITVRKGYKVAKGERIGLVGNTSITRRTELHFEIRKDGKPINPLDELPKAQ